MINVDSLVRLVIHFLFLIIQCMSCFAILLNSSSNLQILEQQLLIPCCPYQNSFQNGNCKKENYPTTINFPNTFRNWTDKIKLNCMEDEYFKEIQIDIDEINSIGNGFIRIGNEIYNENNYCIDGIENKQVNVKSCEKKCSLTKPCFNKCCPPGGYLGQKLNTSIYNSDNYICIKSTQNNKTWDFPKIYSSSGIEENLHFLQLQSFGKFPNCKTLVQFPNTQFRAMQDGTVIISNDNSSTLEQHLTKIWLSLNINTFCMDQYDDYEEYILLTCHDAMYNELKKIEIFLKTFLNHTFASAAKLTGGISLAAAIIIGFALIIYILLWNQRNVHRCTQFSFLLALFCTYLIAGLRRLIGYEKLIKLNMAEFFDAFEDFGAVSTSGNLVAISFDLFFTLWKSKPTFHRNEGMKRFTITTILAWSIGLIVMIIGLITKPKQTYKIEHSELSDLKKYLPKLLEFFLCIQNDMLFSICLPIIQLCLFSFNLILFIGSVIVLFIKKIETKMAYENFKKSQIFKFWVKRFIKLIILCGLWWPLIVLCVFECTAMFNHTVKQWTIALRELYYIKPEYANFQIPWHMHLVPNLLALQAILTCSLFVLNRRTWNGLKKLYTDRQTKTKRIVSMSTLPTIV